MTDISGLTRAFITSRRCFCSNRVSSAFVTGCLLHGRAPRVRSDCHTLIHIFPVPKHTLTEQPPCSPAASPHSEPTSAVKKQQRWTFPTAEAQH